MTRLSKRQQHMLDVMGIHSWQERPVRDDQQVRLSDPSTARPRATESTPPRRVPKPERTAAKTAHANRVTAEIPDVSQLDWQALEAAVSTCTLCDLCNTRNRTVFGTGHRFADWMLIGEAPGAEEDRRGEPFVGRAGQLLDAMLRAIGLERKQAYIANVLKCRPPGNRDPHTGEAERCSGYLNRQIALVQPKLIVAVGRIAAQRLLDTSDSLARLRGKVHHYGAMNTPMIVTYHPAYLLRSPAQKRKAWEDLLLGVRTVREAD